MPILEETPGKPRTVWLEQSDDGFPEAVSLESENGERTILKFGRIPVARQLP